MIDQPLPTVAMQKVEGSSPFSRSQRTPLRRRFLVLAVVRRSKLGRNLSVSLRIHHENDPCAQVRSPTPSLPTVGCHARPESSDFVEQRASGWHLVDQAAGTKLCIAVVTAVDPEPTTVDPRLPSISQPGSSRSDQVPKDAVSARAREVGITLEMLLAEAEQRALAPAFQRDEPRAAGSRMMQQSGRCRRGCCSCACYSGVRG
jgi:hypothetical protein